MRDTSVGLGVIQVVFTVFFAALIVWFALWAGIALVVVWAIYHLVITRHRRVAISPATATDVPAPAITVERTNWVGLVAVLILAAAGIPFMLGTISWPAVGLSAISTACALGGMANPTSSKVTKLALRTVAILGGAVALIGTINLLVDRPVTLYGQNWGDRQGEMTSISQLQAELPCVEEPTSPAAAEQRLFTLDVEKFVATSSCRLSLGDRILPAVFVEASSPSELERIFEAGVLSSAPTDDGDLWVQRDGAVAVITADAVSADLAQNVGQTWISLDDKPRIE